MTSRREFVHGALAALILGEPGRWVAGAASPRLASSLDRLPPERYPLARHPRAGDPEFRTLAARALEAAEAAGASYADVRLTVTYTSLTVVPPSVVLYDEHAALGVRAFVDGAWGFAGGTVWGRDEAARLGQGAAANAALHAASRQQKLELGAPPPVVTGEWTTPIRVDPFAASPVEQLAVLEGHFATIGRLFPEDKDLAGNRIGVQHRRQEKAFASTTGSFLTQTLHTTHPFLGLAAGPPDVMQTVDRLQPTAQGWEVMLDGTLDGELQQIAEAAIALAQNGQRRVEPGRYDVVCDAYTVAHLLGRTVGLAAELDRALGYEAAASGTSYLAPPATALGTFSFGTPLLTVTANRSQLHGLATVKWDDEGVAPDEYPVVQDGVLVDYHTTRELVAPLAAAYTTRRQAVRSHGCAAVEHGGRMPLVQCPNLTLQPATTATSFEDLVAGLEKGLVITVGTETPPSMMTRVTADSQQLNGELVPLVAYEVRNGKRTQGVRGVECLFRAPELWKSLQALGGAASQRTAGCLVEKGQPTQRLGFSVTAVPARFQQLTVIT